MRELIKSASIFAINRDGKKGKNKEEIESLKKQHAALTQKKSDLATKSAEAAQKMAEIEAKKDAELQMNKAYLAAIAKQNVANTNAEKKGKETEGDKKRAEASEFMKQNHPGLQPGSRAYENQKTLYTKKKTPEPQQFQYNMRSWVMRKYLGKTNEMLKTPEGQAEIVQSGMREFGGTPQEWSEFIEKSKK